MIYLFHGSNVGKVRAKAFQWVAATRAKVPDAFYVRLSAEAVSEESLSEAMSMQGLFFSKTLIVLDDPFAKEESSQTVLNLLPDLAKSPNVIAIVAPKLLAARTKKITAVAEKVFVEDVTSRPARGFNSGLVNALAAKDGALLWQELMRAYRQGDVPELLHGLLHWKARDLMQKGGRGWSKDEARILSRDLILLLSDSRGRDLPLAEGLERFALSLSPHTAA